MLLILLEAAGALALLLSIVWWTMFSGRDRGEPRHKQADDSEASASVTSSSPAPMTTAVEREDSRVR